MDRADFNTALGAEIKRLRITHGATLHGLGKAIGVAFQQVQKYEKGHNAVSCFRLVSIAAALDTTPEAILTTVLGEAEIQESENGREILTMIVAYKQLPAALRMAVRSLMNALNAMSRDGAPEGSALRLVSRKSPTIANGAPRAAQIKYEDIDTPLP